VSRAALLLALTGVACGPKIDPLVPLRAELAAAKKAGTGPHPHLRFALAEQTALAVVEKAAGLDRELVLSLGMGAAAKVDVGLRNPRIRVRPSDHGPHLDLDIGGGFSATVSSILGTAKLADGLGFTATLGGGVRFGLRGDQGDQIVELRPVKRDPFVAEVTLAEEKGPLTNQLVNQQLAGLLEQTFAKPVLLGRIPDTVPIRAAGLRLLPDDVPTAGVWLQARGIDSPVPEARPDRGWTLATSDDAVLYGVRAVAARMKQHRTWQIEPRQLTVQPTRFEGVVRVHKVARKLKWRDYRVTGTVELGERLKVRATEVEEIDKAGWGGSLIGPFVKGQVKRRVRRIDLDLPAKTDQPIGNKAAVTWTLRKLRRVDGGLVVEGDLAGKRMDP
jgi:hypothetical protein